MTIGNNLNYNKWLKNCRYDSNDVDSNVESPTASRVQNESSDPDPESGEHDSESGDQDQDQDQDVYDGTQHLKKESVSRLNSRRATDFSQVQIWVFKQKFQPYYYNPCIQCTITVKFGFVQSWWVKRDCRLHF